MRFSGNMCFKIISKVTKNQGFTLTLEDKFFEKPQGDQFDLPRQIRVNRATQLFCNRPFPNLTLFKTLLFCLYLKKLVNNLITYP